MALLLLIFIFLSWSSASPGFNSVDSVVIIGIDGLHLGTLERAMNTTHASTFASLRTQSSFTADCRSQATTISAPNWGSILFATGMEFHGISSNAWTRESANVVPRSGACSLPPNFFSVAMNQDPTIKTGAFYSWDKLNTILEPKSHITREVLMDCESCGGCGDILPKLVKNFTSEYAIHRFNISFIHVDFFDRCAAENGFFGDDILQVVKQIDEAVLSIVQALNNVTNNKYMLLIISDHGRDSRGGYLSGGFEMAQISTQWLAFGNSVKQGHTIDWPVANMDTAPTALHALGFKQPVQFRGRPVLDIFTDVQTVDQTLKMLSPKDTKDPDHTVTTPLPPPFEYAQFGPTRWWSFELLPPEEDPANPCLAPKNLVTKFDYSILSRLLFPLLALIVGFGAGQGVRYAVVLHNMCFEGVDPMRGAIARSDDEESTSTDIQL